MDCNRLKNAVTDIHMPEGMQTRILNNVLIQSRRKFPIRTGFWKRPAALIIEAALFIGLAIPVFVGASETISQIMHRVPPSIARLFQLVQESCTDNGIRMEVVSSSIDGDTAHFYITMQDLTSDRIDGTIDLNDSYFIDVPYDTSAYCQPLGYDEETSTATFMVNLTRMDGNPITDRKITFIATEFLSRKTIYDGIEIPVDLGTVPTRPDTQTVRFTGAGGLGGKEAIPKDHMAKVLVPGTPDSSFPISGIDLTGIGFVDGKLHIQTQIKDLLSNDNHGYFYLIDGDGSQIDYHVSYTFQKETSDGRIDYTDYLFKVTPEQLAECSLYGHFVTAGLLTQGYWSVTFHLDNAQS